MPAHRPFIDASEAGGVCYDFPVLKRLGDDLSGCATGSARSKRHTDFQPGLAGDQLTADFLRRFEANRDGQPVIRSNLAGEVGACSTNSGGDGQGSILAGDLRYFKKHAGQVLCIIFQSHYGTTIIPGHVSVEITSLPRPVPPRQLSGEFRLR